MSFNCGFLKEIKKIKEIIITIVVPLFMLFSSWWACAQKSATLDIPEKGLFSIGPFPIRHSFSSLLKARAFERNV